MVLGLMNITIAKTMMDIVMIGRMNTKGEGIFLRYWREYFKND